ncbi:hypothetical protein [Psychroserpens damuponensis]|uniref:hypothetical protein n=1 Tax=Psychroserpens damuponensis TaxID=943936 RepID=UPI00058BCEB4|nr:hypothetical protein [Psychroserpens damuponensis]
MKRLIPGKYDIVVLFFFVIFSLGALYSWVFEEQFNAKEWHARPSKRYKIVDDFINDEIFIGKSKADIIKILGTPVDPLISKKDLLNYKIGTPPSFKELKREELIIIFENDVATEAFRVRMEE